MDDLGLQKTSRGFFVSQRAYIGEMKISDYIVSQLGEETGQSSKTVKDELYSMLFDAIVQDAMPKKPLSLEEHDKKVHDGHFDPATMTCKFRDKMKQLTPEDKADLIYATSDVHHTGIENITDKDCGTIVLAGDFMEKAKKQENFKDAEKWWGDKFLPWCEDHKDQQIVIIGGNCDKWLYKNRGKVKWPKNVHYLDDTATEVNGMKVYGTSWCPHNMSGAWEVDNSQLEKEFAKIPEGLDILVTHVPPKMKGLDIDHDKAFDSHFGSEALTKAILEKKPKIVLCGHIHSGSHKPVKIGDSLVMNVSRVDDDRYERAFHGRKIGVERTDEGLGFLVDMDDEGRIDYGKREDVPDSILALREALRDAAKSINSNVDSGDYSPDKKKIAKAIDAIMKSKEDMKSFDHPQKKMLEAAIQSLSSSEESGWKKRMNRIGKMFEGDGNGEGFKFSWEGGKGLPSKAAKKYSAYTDEFGKFIDMWDNGKGIADIIANEPPPKPTLLDWGGSSIEDSPFDEWGLPKKKKKVEKTTMDEMVGNALMEGFLGLRIVKDAKIKEAG